MNTLDLGVALYKHDKDVHKEVMHYYGILSIYGLLKISELKGNEVLKKEVIKIISRFPDEIEHPHYNFPSYRICGMARAYALYKGIMTDDTTVKLVREYAEEIMTAPRDSRGIMTGPSSKERDLIWIDIAMAVTPYLLFAGLYFQEDRYIDEAINQATMMYDLFLDKENGLLHQSQGFIASGVISEDHWSRGNAWGYIALTELIEHLPLSHPRRREVEEYFAAHSWALLKHSTERCLWNQEIAMDCYEETSGSALFLYGFGIGMKKNVLDPLSFEECFQTGIKNIVKYFINSDFSVTNCCPGCLCRGYGRVRGTAEGYAKLAPVKDDVHAFGPLLLMLSEAYESGITEVEICNVHLTCEVR